MKILWIQALSVLSSIQDCDEVFNYYEPLHYLWAGVGLQTWEYSVDYVVRSILYLLLHLSFVTGKIYSFYSLRTALVCCGIACESLFVTMVSRRYGHQVGQVLCVFLLSPGMFIALPSFLPSTFSMLMHLLAFTLESHSIYLYVLCMVIGITWGWPFIAFLGIVYLAEVIAVGKYRVVWYLVQGAILSVPVVGLAILVDSFYYGKFVFAAMNIVLYNVFSQHGPDLYGTEPWWFYLANGLLNFNVAFLLAIASLPVYVPLLTRLYRLASRMLPGASGSSLDSNSFTFMRGIFFFLFRHTRKNASCTPCFHYWP
jgi:alpha-1,2-mannosyltransferase